MIDGDWHGSSLRPLINATFKPQLTCEWMMRRRGDMTCFHAPCDEAWHQGDDAYAPHLSPGRPRKHTDIDDLPVRLQTLYHDFLQHYRHLHVHRSRHWPSLMSSPPMSSPPMSSPAMSYPPMSYPRLCLTPRPCHPRARGDLATAFNIEQSVQDSRVRGNDTRLGCVLPRE